MRNRFNNILIGLLWLIAVSLGATFWFNTKYGFNIFSIQHWQYLAYMQASNQPVKSSFYISLIVIVLAAVMGLYWLLQPRRRKIILPIFDSPTSAPQKPQNTQTPAIVPEKNSPVVTQLTPETPPVTITESQNPNPSRPPRLNISMPQRTIPSVPHVPLQTTPTKRLNSVHDNADIREIFESNGFVYKGSPRIKGVQTSVIAIGTDEILWIGATGVSTTDMQRAIDALAGVFFDTLEDIEIHINAFIIDATDNATSDSILRFASVDDLRTYICEHPNKQPDEDEIENFDAYSGYIGTVVDYIGKI